VLFLLTTHKTRLDQLVIRHRKRPATTSTLAKTARQAFGPNPEKDLPIPKFVDDYNHYMGYVDQADQRQASNPGLRRIRRGGWHAVWNFIFNVILVNSFLLSDYKTVYMQSIRSYSTSLILNINRYISSGLICKRHC
jgi:hypothetical protein